jgi:hypothetical protein
LGDETGWTAIYGLNLGCCSPERAAREAACAVQMLGGKLDAFQIGNEVDYFNRWKRPPSWNFDSYWGEYSTFVKAIRIRTPSAPFAGPDVANKTGRVEQYADHARHDSVFLTSHYYRMGPPNAPGIDNQRLLAPNPLLPPRIAAVMSASRSAGIPYRATEVNSCSHGGMKGVSDAFAPVSLATAGVREKSKRVSVLRGPALDATTGTVLETGKGSRLPHMVAPHSVELHTYTA